ncbi:MAG TPA: bifunctional UDP-N-acetylglucosamine diphosphorylase/glucosamine-1-phosphate N-acetyltransferase GlmU [Magnetospirillaceae bacterium]|jgi:bifunctional UDP-N-acetylglucosamine pyrophosphorylase/glucosamine-1-phosphate N-acetyltransferase
MARSRPKSKAVSKTKPTKAKAKASAKPIAKRPFAAVILAAGAGTRMKSALPKPLHKIAGRPMIAHLLDTLAGMGAAKTVVVVGPGMESVAKAVAPHPTVIQHEQRGTGHAVMQAEQALAGFEGTVLVLYADTPLIKAETFAAMLDSFHLGKPPAVTVLGFRPTDPAAYGRLVMKGQALQAIVEAKDATAAQKKIGLVNAGAMAADAKHLWTLLKRVKPNNAKNEFYLTDVVGLARKAKLNATMVEGSADEVLGVNSRDELSVAEGVMQRRMRIAAMENGATLIDPKTTFFSWDTKLGRDVTVGPFVVFGSKVVVEDGAEIRAFSHLEGAHVGPRAVIGPFARLRPNSRIGADAHIGNFVEIKQAVVEDGAKANHLTYIGDARVGAGANIGAGTITCNYDGFNKSFTDIGAGAFIGSNTALVAPVRVGNGAVTGAGSVITHDIPDGALTIERNQQIDIPGGADKLREKKRAIKAAAKSKVE